MPLYRRTGKLGFRSRQKVLGLNQYHVIDVAVLNKFEDGAMVDSAALLALGYGRHNRNRAGVKILGTGNLTKKLTVKVEAISATAKEKVEAAGGSVELVK
jgi:large subunit ribosomal protein L15